VIGLKAFAGWPLWNVQAFILR